jgi:hypothetical protein
MDNQGSGQTGTRDTTYDLTAVLYHALQGVENCQTYAQDARSGDQHLQQFFQQAGDQQRQLAEQAKQLLHDCLMKETQGGQGGSGGQGSAFGFGQGDQSQPSEMAGGQSGGTGGSSY